jgi:hypothetical protein
VRTTALEADYLCSPSLVQFRLQGRSYLKSCRSKIRDRTRSAPVTRGLHGCCGSRDTVRVRKSLPSVRLRQEVARLLLKATEMPPGGVTGFWLEGIKVPEDWESVLRARRGL